MKGTGEVDYLVAYRYHGNFELMFYHFNADDAEHALEQFRSAEPNEELEVVFIVMY